MKKSLSESVSFASLCLDYVRPRLGQRAYKLFLRCHAKPSTWFLDEVAFPALYNENTDSYIPISNTLRTPGRNHYRAKKLSETCGTPEGFRKGLADMALFANPLRIDRTGVVKPSLRMHAGEHLVFTLEFDVPDPAFLARMIGWVTPKKNPLDCEIGRFYAACSAAYADFVGINVTWAGNKSLHFHVVFATALAKATFGLGDRSPTELRHGYRQLWHRLHKMFVDTIDTDGRSADESLASPEQYRRLPGAMRKVEAGHILGVPEDTMVPQITLWEKHQQRVGAQSLPLFMTADTFTLPPVAIRGKSSFSATSHIGLMSAEQVAYCSAQLAEIYSGWLRFAHLAFEQGRYVAKFFNSPYDRMPSSIMREDFSTVNLCGCDAHTVGSPVRLPQPLGLTLRFWCEQLRAERGGDTIQSSDDAIGKLVTDFAEAVIDKDSAHAAMRALFLQTLAIHARMLVVGPEGIGKTTTLFKLYRRAAIRLGLAGESQIGMFAFADYNAAIEKCEKFSDEDPTGCVGRVLKSFSRLYEEICVQIGVRQISRAQAARDGYSSVFAAIYASQPKVVALLREHHAQMWRAIGNRVPVFFSVHGVMHHWRNNSISRQFWSPSFWERIAREESGADLNGDDFVEELKLGIAVHDEVKNEDIVAMYRDEVCRWVKRLVAENAGAWRGKTASLSDKLETYEDFLERNGPPLLEEETLKIDFEEVLKVDDLNREGSKLVIARDSGEYHRLWRKPEEDAQFVSAYDRAIGRKWCVAQHDWWDGLAHQTILLTTERVPASLVAGLDAGWSIFDLGTPNVERTAMAVYPSSSVTGANLYEVCDEFQKRPGEKDTFIVSNKVKELDDTMSHVVARGSNALIGKNVMQTMTYFTPDKFEELQVLNEWTGRSDMVGLSHIDECNQTAGRNLGFRWDGMAKHTLLINLSLYRLLTNGPAIRYARYRWDHVTNKDQRYDFLKALNPPSPTPH